MNERKDIWSVLGIECTRDIRQIKKAYARQVAKFHPEEQPKEFERLRNAYEIAKELASVEEDSQAETLYVQDTTDNILPVTENPDISYNRDENEDKQAEHISRLADNYAWETEKQRNRQLLYKNFLIEIAINKISKRPNEDKDSLYKKWCGLMLDPIILEAIHNHDFLDKLARQIRKENLSVKTVRKIKQVIEQEIPNELKEHKELRCALEIVGNEKRKLGKLFHVTDVLPLIMIIFVIILLAGSLKKGEKQSGMEIFRKNENIEAYIENKYGILALVSEKKQYNGGDYSGSTEIENDSYYLVETVATEGVPDTFELTWDKESMDYGEIKDNLKSETFYMYAKKNNLDASKALYSQNVIHTFEMPREKFEADFLNFLTEIQKSKYVQSGHSMTVTVRQSFKDIPQISVTINRETESDVDVVKEKLDTLYK